MEYRNKTMPREEPKSSKGISERVKTGCGNFYVTVNSDELGPCGVIIHLGKSGGCASAFCEAVQNLVTASLLAGVSFKAIISCLKSIRCPSIAWEDGKSILSCADAVAAVLEKRLTSEKG